MTSIAPLVAGWVDTGSSSGGGGVLSSGLLGSSLLSGGGLSLELLVRGLGGLLALLAAPLLAHVLEFCEGSVFFPCSGTGALL